MESGLVPLASCDEEGGAENCEESGGRFRDFVTHELDAIDCGHVSCSGDVHCRDIEHVRGEAVVAHVIACR